MGPEFPPEARLIALEGACGEELKLTAKRLLPNFCQGELAGGISYWNVSGIFAELRLRDPNISLPSPRTLLLLYAADLAFRLHWEIRPALEQGQVVIAAPYVHTAIALGKAAGVSRRWLLELFRFAPRPEACYRIQEGAPTGNPSHKPEDGFFEFCCAALQADYLPSNLAEFHRRLQAYLDGLERRRRCKTVTAQFLAESGSGP